jgi:probable HAF family extracellular repeat protein
MKHRQPNRRTVSFHLKATLRPLVQALAVSLVAAVTCSHAQSLQFLPVPPGVTDVLPAGISSDGTVVVANGTGAAAGFLWTSTSGSSAIGILPGFQSALVTALSGDGSTAVGTLDWFTAFRYQNGVMEDLGSLDGPGAFSMANAANHDGSVVVGASSAGGGTSTHAFRWTTSGMQDLGALPGGDYAEARGVSADGNVVAGLAFGSSGFVAFRWSQVDGMQELGSLPGSAQDSAYAVSADGATIVGESRSEPVRWVGGVAYALGAIPGSPYGIASSVTDDGRMIGGGWFDQNYDFGGGFVWTEPTGTLDLASLLVSQGVDMTDIRILQLMDMSADGSSLVAWGLKGNEYGAILITDFAVPEAQPLSGAASLLAFGVASSWLRLRRQRRV